MSNTQKPLLWSHQFVGEDEAHDLVVWMNFEQYPKDRWVKVENTRPAFRRVFQILELAKEVENARQDGTSKTANHVAQLQRLNHAIARYTFKPRLADPGTAFFLTWRRPKLEEVIPSEHRAILSLLRLLELRLLYRVRACSWCTSWFFAKYKHQKFCRTKGAACQQKHYASSPEFRNERRTYMREYRRKHGW